MDQNQASPPGVSEGRANFQSIEEFMKEQDELDAARLATGKSISPPTPTNTPPSKKVRRAIDVEALSLEARALAEIGDTNWTGRLLEFRVVTPPVDGLKYIDSVIGAAPSRFSCLAVLTESSRPFGDTVSFSKKKDAKQYASKKAIDWLIENNFMPSVGVKFPKPIAVKQAPTIPKVTTPQATKVPVVRIKEIIPQSPAPTPKSTSKSSSFAGQIPELCTRLGFTVPTYEITKVSENASLYSGFAHFNGDPRIEGKVGEVTGIYGQKNAKEMIAEELHSFLKDIERQRMDVMKTSEAEEA